MMYRVKRLMAFVITLMMLINALPISAIAAVAEEAAVIENNDVVFEELYTGDEDLVVENQDPITNEPVSASQSSAGKRVLLGANNDNTYSVTLSNLLTTEASLGANYYVFARFTDNGTAYYAIGNDPISSIAFNDVGTGNEVNIGAFLDASNNGFSGTIPESVEVGLYKADSRPTPSDIEGNSGNVKSNGALVGEYILGISGDAISVTAAPKLTISFVEGDGSTPANANLCGYTHVVVSSNSGRVKAAAPLTVNGTTATATLSVYDSNSGDQLYLVKYSGSGDLYAYLMGETNLWNHDQSGAFDATSKVQIQANTTFGVFKFSNNPTVNETDISVTAEKLPAYTVNFTYSPSDLSGTLTKTYYVYVQVEDPNENNKVYAAKQSVPVSGGKLQSVSFAQFVNGNTISYNSNLTIKDVQLYTSNPELTNGQVNNPPASLNGGTSDGFSFALNDEKNNYTVTAAPKYAVTLAFSDSVAADTTFSGYLVAKITRNVNNNNTDYFYDQPVTLTKGTSFTPIEISQFTDGNGNPVDYLSTDTVSLYLGNNAPDQNYRYNFGGYTKYTDGEVISNNGNDYIISIAPATNAATITLQKPVEPVITVSQVKEDASTAADSALLNRTDGKYYLYVELTQNGSKGYAVEPITASTITQNHTISSFTAYEESGNAVSSYLIDGSYIASLIFVPDTATNLSTTASVLQAVGGKNELKEEKKKIVFYSNDEVIEAGRLSTGIGTASAPNSTVKVVKMPPLQVETKVETTALTTSNHYYLLVDMTEMVNGEATHRYALKPVTVNNTNTNTYDIDQNFTDSEGNSTYYYDGEKDVSIMLVRAASSGLSLTDAIAGTNCSRFSENQVTEGYKVS